MPRPGRDYRRRGRRSHTAIVAVEGTGSEAPVAVEVGAEAAAIDVDDDETTCSLAIPKGALDQPETISMASATLRPTIDDYGARVSR